MAAITGASFTPPSAWAPGGGIGGPHLIAGPDGRMWVNGGTTAYLAAFNTTTFAATFYALGAGLEGFDCCTDGTFIYAICENTSSLTGQLLKVTTAGSVSTLASWSLATGGGYYAGSLSCVFDGTYIWVFGGANNSKGIFWRVTTGGTVTAYTVTASISSVSSLEALTVAAGQFWLTCGATSTPVGIYVAPDAAPSALTTESTTPLNEAFGLAAYDGTSIWVASSTAAAPVPYVVKVNPSTYAATSYGTSNSGDGYSLIFDGTLLWVGGISASGAASFSPASPTVVTTYITYTKNGVAGVAFPGGSPGLDSAGNVWWVTDTTIATNKAPAATQQLVMMP